MIDQSVQLISHPTFSMCCQLFCLFLEITPSENIDCFLYVFSLTFDAVLSITFFQTLVCPPPHINTCTHTHLLIFTQMCTHTHTLVSSFVHMYSCKCLHTYTWMPPHIYIYIYTQIWVEALTQKIHKFGIYWIFYKKCLKLIKFLCQILLLLSLILSKLLLFCLAWKLYSST